MTNDLEPVFLEYLLNPVMKQAISHVYNVMLILLSSRSTNIQTHLLGAGHYSVCRQGSEEQDREQDKTPLREQG